MERLNRKMSIDMTVCIPLNDPENRNELYLREALESIVCQTVRPSQVVMTSNTDIEYVHGIVQQYSGYFEMIYRVNETNGASMNFNNCVALATGRFIHFLCQDDVIKSHKHLQIAYKKLIKSKKRWLISGSRHFKIENKYFGRRIRPSFTNRLIEGINTIGAPSVVTFCRTTFIPFDTDLHFMYDCDWYLRMCHNWGKPFVLRKAAIGVRIHKNQSTYQVSGLLESEIKIANRTHCNSNTDTCICVVNKVVRKSIES
jgi:hypothetical protein